MRQRVLVCPLVVSALTALLAAPLAAAPLAAGTPPSTGQAAAPPSNAQNTHIYRVSAFRAAPGRRCRPL